MIIKKNSQISIEFMMMSGLALITAIIFVSVSLAQAKNLQQTKELLLLKDIALKIQKEVSIASYTEDGYSREFELPEKVVDRNYNISMVNGTLIVWTNASSYFVRVFNITGQLKKEKNTITKTSGIVYVNQ